MTDNPTCGIEQWIIWGKDLDRKNLHHEAINCFRVATVIDATLPEELVLKGQAFAYLGDYWSASAFYESAIKLDPSLAISYNQLGVSIEEQAYLVEEKFGWNSAKQLYENALVYYDKAIQINSSYADALNNKGITLIYLHRYSEAIDCFNMVKGMDSDCPDVYFNLSIAYSKIGMRIGDAESNMRIAIESGLSIAAELMEEGLSRELAK